MQIPATEQSPRHSRASSVPAKRTPELNHGILPCIDCGAEIGEHCISSLGTPHHRGHVSRIRLAIRKMDEDATHELDCEDSACDEELHAP